MNIAGARGAPHFRGMSRAYERVRSSLSAISSSPFLDVTLAYPSYLCPYAGGYTAPLPLAFACIFPLLRLFTLYGAQQLARSPWRCLPLRSPRRLALAGAFFVAVTMALRPSSPRLDLLLEATVAIVSPRARYHRLNAAALVAFLICLRTRRTSGASSCRRRRVVPFVVLPRGACRAWRRPSRA